MSTGALDIAFAPGSESESTLRRSVAAHAEAIASSRARHPYAVIGHDKALSAIAIGMRHLTQALTPAGLAPTPLDATRANDAYVSSLGALMPAASALKIHAPIRGEGAIACIQLDGDTSFDAAAVAKAVQHDAPNWGRKVTIEHVAVRFDGRLPNIALARKLDDLATADTLAKELGSRARGYATVIVPPVMGLTRYVQVLEMLSAAAGAPVVEALAHMPSVPGVRLQMALDKAVRDAGVTLVGDVVSPITRGHHVLAMRGKGGEELPARAFVLATGRFISGGVVFNTRCREALFDLPTVSELGLLEKDAPQSIVRADPRESHPLMTAGLQVSPQLQPIVEGRVAYDNLFAAGMVIGGFASRYALCADGVALASGVLAARSGLAV